LQKKEAPRVKQTEAEKEPDLLFGSLMQMAFNGELVSRQIFEASKYG